MCVCVCVCVCVRVRVCVQEDAQEEFGWKLVHGDVFRPPRKGMLLSVFLGSGTQIFIMTFVTLCESGSHVPTLCPRPTDPPGGGL